MNQNVELILQVDTPLAKAEGILDSQNRLADAELLQQDLRMKAICSVWLKREG